MGFHLIAGDGAHVAHWSLEDPENRVDAHLARAEFAAAQVAQATAEQMSALADVLDEARQHPDIWMPIHDEPTPDDIQIAVDSAIADLAMRLSIAEGTVAVLAHQASVLRLRAPRVWATFREGAISAANARRLADVFDTLPDDADLDAALDSAALDLAALAPARFRERLRVLRERLNPRSLTERHQQAVEKRRAWREDDHDGMAWLGVHLAAVDADAAWQRIDGIARHLADCDGETRTLDQLRADAAADLLTGRTDPATAPRVTVGVLVPMMTLLGLDEMPATLDGYGPIDADTARRLAAHAPSFHRILTHPVSGAVLDVDRTSYRPPVDLTRWVALRDVTCRFWGCGRRASACDIDHTIAWADGGATSASNLAHLSRRHHTLKHRSKWRVEQHSDGTLTWTSPTGAVRHSDPPPF